MNTVNPYLTFDGDCEQAFEFYAQALNCPIVHTSRYKDMPDSTASAEEGEKIMHIVLQLTEQNTLMGADVSRSFGQSAVEKGDNVSLSVNVESREEADRIFVALAQGGDIAMPISDTFWGAYFGMLRDKFGIHWMVNYDDPAKVQK